MGPSAGGGEFNGGEPPWREQSKRGPMGGKKRSAATWLLGVGCNGEKKMEAKVYGSRRTKKQIGEVEVLGTRKFEIVGVEGSP